MSSEKKHILVTDGMAPTGVSLLEEHSDLFSLDVRKSTPQEDLEEAIPNCDVIIIRSATTLTKDLIDRGKNLKLIVRAGAGVDNIDVSHATQRDIPVMNTASANSLAAAEQTIGMIFCMLRQIPQAHASLAGGKWERSSFKGYEVTGKTLGIVGLGNIGRIVAEKAIGLGMRVVGYDPGIKSISQVPQLAKFDESVSIVKTLEEVLPIADILTLHVPKMKETQNLIQMGTIQKMKDGAFLVNCARGGIVNEKDVLSALEHGKLKGAAFDVFEKEPPEFPVALASHPAVVCTPHIGASTHEAQERVGITAAQQIIGFFKNKDKRGIINL